MESGQKNRRATQALILFVLGAALTYCSEPDDNLLVGGDSTGLKSEPPVVCDANGVAVSFQTRTRGYVEVTCPSAGQTATEAEAKPYSGFQFERWTNGDEQVLTQTLVIENPSEAQTWTAEFSTSGLSTVWLAYSFVKQSQTYLEDIVKETETSEGLGFNQHTDEIFANGGCKGSPGFMRVEAEEGNGNGTSAAAYIDDPANEGKIDNLVLTYYPHVGSTFEDYKYWIDKLNVHNPNARVFIVTPWSRGPEVSHSLHTHDSGCEDLWPADAKDESGNYINVEPYTSQRYVYEDENRAVDIEKDIYYSEDESILASLPTFKKNVLNQLEEKYSNKIMVVPQIALASRILQAQYQNTLSYGDDSSSQAILDVTGEMDTSVFSDSTGHGSRILRVSAAMLYASYLYDEDIDTEAYRSDVWDSKDKYSNSGGPDFNKPLSYFQGLDLVDLVSDIYNGEDTTEYQCDGHRVTLRAGANGSIEGKSRRCITDGESTSVQAIADAGSSVVKWSDGVAGAPRVLIAGDNINEDITLTANFLEAGPGIKRDATYTVNGRLASAAECSCEKATPQNPGEDCTDANEYPELPANKTYTYGKGIRYSGVANTAQTNLQLDVYKASNAPSEERPAFMFIHGGSFDSNSTLARKSCDIRKMAYYFASRGWVFISISYRTADNLFINGPDDIPNPTDEEEQILMDYLIDKNLDEIVPSAWKDWTIENAVSMHPLSKFRSAKSGISMYMAQRDAKAALRSIVAKADLAVFNIDTDYITVGGHSAGAITALTLGISNQEDFRDELLAGNEAGDPVDPTLTTTNLNETYSIRSIVNFWGGPVKLDNYEAIYGNYRRYDRYDPELLTLHGKNDPNSFTPKPCHGEYAVTGETCKNFIHEFYTDLGIYNKYVEMNGAGHDAWDWEDANSNGIYDYALDFLIDRQNLEVLDDE